MNEIERTQDMLHRALKEVNDKGDYNNVTIDLVGKIVDALKDIKMMNENHTYGRGGNWTAEGRYDDRDYYEGRYHNRMY